MWPVKNFRIRSDVPVILQLDDDFLVISYHYPSSMALQVCCKEALENDMNIVDLLQKRPRKFARNDIKKRQLEGRRITNITVERFSDAFECNSDGDIRPAGGDYFSTIRLYLDHGNTLCLTGADSICDGYSELWCE